MTKIDWLYIIIYAFICACTAHAVHEARQHIHMFINGFLVGIWYCITIEAIKYFAQRRND